jgi:prephenate dehydrogenase
MNRLAILGTGLIGGSIGLGWRRVHPDAPVVGYDGDAASIRRAFERGAVTEVASSPGRAAAGADLIVVALPVDRIGRALEVIGPLAPPGAVVTDVGSAKADVVAGGEEIFGGRFVGGHPMAGSEEGGIDSADEGLFEGARWILTPTERTDPAAYEVAAAFVRSLGASVVAVGPSVHDGLLARISHVPQVVASAVVAAAVGGGDRPAHLALAAGGFRDVTRIAASPPDLWVSILRSNPRAVLEGIEGVRAGLLHAADLIEAGRWEDLRGWLGAARRDRTSLFAKPGPQLDSVALILLVPDRPGVLAEVTTAAGTMGANIEDLRIVHSPEGGRGRLELTIGGAAPAAELTDALERLGYHVLPGQLGDM